MAAMKLKVSNTRARKEGERTGRVLRGVIKLSIDSDTVSVFVIHLCSAHAT